VGFYGGKTPKPKYGKLKQEGLNNRAGGLKNFCFNLYKLLCLKIESKNCSFYFLSLKMGVRGR